MNSVKVSFCSLYLLYSFGRYLAIGAAYETCEHTIGVEHGVVVISGTDSTSPVSSECGYGVCDLKSEDGQDGSNAVQKDDTNSMQKLISPETFTILVDDDGENPRIDAGFGEVQSIYYDPELAQQRLSDMLLYMQNNFTSTNSMTNDTEVVACLMQHELCAYWAARGECEVRPGKNHLLHGFP
jgi:hypothetical protein